MVSRYFPHSPNHFSSILAGTRPTLDCDHTDFSLEPPKRYQQTNRTKDTMAFQSTPVDVSVIISTPSGTQANVEPGLHTERRVTPTWTVMQLKSKLETMTGIPPGSQHLRFKAPGRLDQWIDGDDRIIGEWGLIRGCEIEVCF